MGLRPRSSALAVESAAAGDDKVMQRPESDPGAGRVAAGVGGRFEDALYHHLGRESAQAGSAKGHLP